MGKFTQRGLARELNRSPGYINKLVKTGILQVVDGLIDVDDARRAIAASKSIAHGYLDELNQRQRGEREDARPPSGGSAGSSTVKSQYDRARAMREAFSASLQRLEYDRKSGAVVLVSDVARLVSEEYAHVRRRLLAIPAEQAVRVHRAKSVADVQEVLHEVISEALEALTRDREYSTH